MYKITVKKYGPPDLLKYQKVSNSILKHNEIKIKVVSAGVNFADTLIIKGKYQERPRPPFSPGLEVAGTVLEIGKRVKRFKVGDSVMSIMKYGGYKQVVNVPEENTYNIPFSMPLDIAGGFPVAYGTAYTALITKAKIKKGNRPSYIQAAEKEQAIELYEKFIKDLSESISKEVFSGNFGADMQVSLVNDGPVTIIIDTKNKE